MSITADEARALVEAKVVKDKPKEPDTSAADDAVDALILAAATAGNGSVATPPLGKAKLSELSQLGFKVVLLADKTLTVFWA